MTGKNETRSFFGPVVRFYSVTSGGWLRGERHKKTSMEDISVKNPCLIEPPVYWQPQTALSEWLRVQTNAKTELTQVTSKTVCV